MRPIFLLLAVLAASLFVEASAERGAVAGAVRDTSGGVVAGARVSLVQGHVTVATTTTDNQGAFLFKDVASGAYELIAHSPGFAEMRAAVRLRSTETARMDVKLELEQVSERVTVSAGGAENAADLDQRVNIIGQQQLEERARLSVAEAVREEPGLALQRTSSTIAGVFVRGLAGNRVNLFVDGVRFSNTAARGGINTFLSLLEPSNLRAVEVVRGPDSAQFGSDAIGGSLQLLSRLPELSSGPPQTSGHMNTFFHSADASFGGNLQGNFSSASVGVLVNLAARRVNTLRAGRGLDSHAAVTRYLGLPSDFDGRRRLGDTGFTQYGGLIKVNWLAGARDRLVAHYQRGQQDGSRRSDQLDGGDGNLVADIRNLMLDLFYVRYHRSEAGPFEQLSLAYSFNTQREERVEQGGRGDPLALVTHQRERTSVHGLEFLLEQTLVSRHQLLLGGDFYRDAIAAPAFGVDPATGRSAVRRPRIPSRARSSSGGLYAQAVSRWLADRLRLTAGGRGSHLSYRARAADAPRPAGIPLWNDDRLTAADFSFRAGAAYSTARFGLSANVSRGFRAPHMTDLGTLGLTGSGFEVAEADVRHLGAIVGDSADSAAVSTGIPLAPLRPETSWTSELGGRISLGRVTASLTGFVNDIDEIITRQTLILPAGAVGRFLGSDVITRQISSGAVFVEASPAPVLARANFGKVRILGLEHSFQARLDERWRLDIAATWLRASERPGGLPPNVEGGTPPPDAWLRLLFAPPGKRYWIESSLHAVDRLTRLSSLALGDRRSGAARSRSSIADFFHHGATARGLVTAGGRLRATGETLLEIQNRVLGPGVESAPLFSALPGYLTVDLRGGVRISASHDLQLAFENITDRNYRGISWGMDGGGRALFLRYKVGF